MRRHRSAALALLVALSFASTAFAQSTDARESEVISVSELGPYRPEEKANLAKARDQIVSMANEFRESEEREPVAVDETLQQAAQKFAEYMARNDRYGHTADGRHPSERATEHGYEYCAIEENIAYQFRTTGFDSAELAKRFVRGWKKSPGHRANMLRRYVTETGVGVAQSEKTGVYYAVQMFGRPQSAMLEFSVSNRSGEEVQYRLGDQTYALPPLTTRTHQTCRTYELSLIADEGEKVRDAAPAEADNGDRFVVRKGDSGLILEKAAR